MLVAHTHPHSRWEREKAGRGPVFKPRGQDVAQHGVGLCSWGEDEHSMAHGRAKVCDG